MSKRNKTYSVPARLSVKAFDETDARKQAQDSIADGLIEPGFVVDAAIDEGPIFELAELED
jgi:hypothetical protein